MTSLARELRERRIEPEWMDEPGLDPELHAAALVGLARLNRVSRTAPMVAETLARGFERLERESPGLGRERPLRLLDLAAGGGDMTRAIDARLRARGWRVESSGCDRSPTAVALANDAARAAGAAVKFFVADLARDGVPKGYDALVNTLFLHHLDERGLASFLAAVGDSGARLTVLHDLARSAFGYRLAWLGSRLLTRSAVVRLDALLSVRASLDRGALERLGRAALGPRGMDVDVRGRFPARLELVATSLRF